MRITAVTLATALFACVGSAHGEMIVNGGFEDGWLGWDVYHNPRVWSLSESDASSGRKCARFEKGGLGYCDAAMRSEPFHLAEGVTYRLEASIRDVNTHNTTGTSTTIIDLAIGPPNWVFARGSAVADPDWQDLRYEFTPLLDSECRLHIQIHGFTTALPGWAEIDSVSLIEVPEPAAATLMVGMVLTLRRRRRRA